MTSDYLTVEEAAELARCHKTTVRRAIADGSLPAFQPTTRILIAESAVRAWIESKPAAAAASRQRTERAPLRRRHTSGTAAAIAELERQARSA